MVRTAALLLLLVSSTAYGEIYTWKDARGTAFYSNSQFEIPARYLSRAKLLDVATGKKLPIPAAQGGGQAASAAPAHQAPAQQVPVQQAASQPPPAPTAPPQQALPSNPAPASPISIRDAAMARAQAAQTQGGAPARPQPALTMSQKRERLRQNHVRTKDEE